MEKTLALFREEFFQFYEDMAVNMNTMKLTVDKRNKNNGKKRSRKLEENVEKIKNQ